MLETALQQELRALAGILLLWARPRPGWDSKSAVVAAASMLLKENAVVLQKKGYFDSA